MPKQQIVTVREAHYLNHDVKRFVVDKPKGFEFIPGQGIDVSLNLPEWKEKKRPFTFTSLNKTEYLEFMVKIYPRGGVTQMLGKVNAGAEFILHGSPFGTIQYKGKGVFIAAGAGVTPFIAILRELYINKQIKGHKLINSNKTEDDVIIGDELYAMLRENFINTYTRQNTIGFLDKHIDKNFLIEHIADFGQFFYVCGPQKFVDNINKLLGELGATSDSLVFEQ